MAKKTLKNEQALLSAALEEFSKKNFDEASMNRILKNAGVSKGVFYYHFQDKEALYLYLVKESSRLKWEFISDEMRNADITILDIFEQFRLQAKAGIQFAALHHQYHRFSQMVAKEKNAAIRAHIQTAFASSDIIGSMVEAAMGSGNLSKNYSKDFLTSVIGYMFAHFFDIFPDDIDAYENLDSYISMMKQGLGVK